MLCFIELLEQVLDGLTSLVVLLWLIFSLHLCFVSVEGHTPEAGVVEAPEAGVLVLFYLLFFLLPNSCVQR